MVARNVRNVVANAANQFAVLLGNGVAGGVRNVDDGCARVDDRLQHLEEVQRRGAAGIFGVELNVANAVARTLCTASTARATSFAFLPSSVLPYRSSRNLPMT